MSVDLGCKDWRETALIFFAEICNRCDVKLKSHDYSLCEKCPKAMTIHRLSEEPAAQEELIAVWDIGRGGHGLMAVVKTEKEAEALKATMDGKWDGCEDCYKIKIGKLRVGLEKFYKTAWFCKHDWTDKIKPWKNSSKIIELKDVFACKKCSERFAKARLKKEKLPVCDGIAYYDETLKRLVFLEEMTRK